MIDLLLYDFRGKQFLEIGRDWILCNSSSTTKTTHIEIEQKEVVSECNKTIELQHSNKISQSNKCTSVFTKTTHIPHQQSCLFDL